MTLTDTRDQLRLTRCALVTDPSAAYVTVHCRASGIVTVNNGRGGISLAGHEVTIVISNDVPSDNPATDPRRVAPL